MQSKADKKVTISFIHFQMAIQTLFKKPNINPCHKIKEFVLVTRVRKQQEFVNM